MPRLAAPTTMNLKRAVLFALRWCGSCALTVFLWAVWLMLVAGIGFQVWIVTHRELSLPDFALRAIERRLAASEVTARFGRAVFDPTGWILFENVQLFGPDRSVPETCACTRSASQDSICGFPQCCRLPAPTRRW
jgi:hypothetical protein